MGLSGQMLKLGWGHRTKNSDVCNASGGRGHRTFQLRVSGQIFKLGWGHRTLNLRVSGQIFKLGWGPRTKV